MKSLYLSALIATIILVSGCSAIQVNNAGQKVYVTNNSSDPKGCTYLGQVVGHQGNYVSGAWTSNADLDAGSLNDLRNNAAELGANYVQIISNRAGQSAGGSFNNMDFSQTTSNVIGNAFKCPKLPMQND